MFSKDYEIKYYDKNLCGTLKEASLLNLMQETATLNADSLGFGQNFVTQKGIAWAIIKYRIELTQPLTNLNNITVATEPRGISKLFAFRNFEFFSNGQLLGKASSSWVLFDIEARKVQPVKKFIPTMKNFVKGGNDLEFNKVTMPENFEYEQAHTVIFDDIDTNHHANNSNYITWALSSLPLDFRKSHNLKNIDICFKKEATFGTKIISLSHIENTTTTHVIKNITTDEILCEFTIDWFKI